NFVRKFKSSIFANDIDFIQKICPSLSSNEECSSYINDVKDKIQEATRKNQAPKFEKSSIWKVSFGNSFTMEILCRGSNCILYSSSQSNDQLEDSKKIKEKSIRNEEDRRITT